MSLTAIRSRAKICITLTMAVAGIALSGCDSHPAALTARPGQASSGASLASHANCVPELTVALADNGATRCVQLYGQITVELRLPDGTWYEGETGVRGSSLRSLPTPNPRSWPVYGATSPGTTVISTIQDSCFTGHPCPALPLWSVTIVVA
jgi:hypothetical protein